MFIFKSLFLLILGSLDSIDLTSLFSKNSSVFSLGFNSFIDDNFFNLLFKLSAFLGLFLLFFFFAYFYFSFSFVYPLDLYIFY